jgi:NADH:ubiquinone oxidoreductase subunit
MEVANWFYCKIFGNKVAKDKLGNVFYESSKLSRYFGRQMRWVYYNGIVEPTKISVAWYSWLHHQTNEAPLKDSPSYGWQNQRTANLTGTKLAYFPPGHTLSTSNKKPKSTGDYHAWHPQK